MGSSRVGTSDGSSPTGFRGISGTSFSHSSRSACLPRLLRTRSRATSRSPYAFNEGSGSTVADLSGNGNVGTLSGASWTTAGKFGSALAFNGSNAARAGGGLSIARPDVRRDARGVGLPRRLAVGLEGRCPEEADSYLLSASSHVGDLRPATGVTVNGSVPNAFGPSTLPVGAWTHLAMTYDGAALRLYVNGVQVGSKPLSGNITPTANPLWIGGNSPYGEYFNGRIDEVRVYRAALSQAEIQADMAAPLGGPPDTTVPSQVSGLVASAVSSSRVDLSWSAASDNVGVTGYEVERCQGAGCSSFAAVTTVSALGWSDTGRSPGTSYSYRVRARDAAGNTGAYSSVATAVTPAAVDNPPSAPTGLSAAAAGSGGVNLSWTAATDDLGVATYEVERCQGAGCSGFVQVATTRRRRWRIRVWWRRRVIRIGCGRGTRGTRWACLRVLHRRRRGRRRRRRRRASLRRTRSTKARAPRVTDRSGNGNTGQIRTATWLVDRQVWEGPQLQRHERARHRTECGLASV